MMNFVWLFMICFSLVCAVINGNTSQLSASVLNGASNAVNLCIKILGSICLWNGLMNIARESGLVKKIEKLLFPVLKFIFPNYSKTDAISAISANITANLLGLGNAATPLGIEAMRRMKNFNGSQTADREMIKFVILNSAALTLIPTTVAVLRQNAGSKSAMSVIFAVWVSSVVSLAAGLVGEKILSRFFK